LTLIRCDLDAGPGRDANGATAFDLDGMQAVVFTSGTTGRPKGAMLSFANHFWSATASAFRLGTRPEDLWLSCLPLYHVGGLAVLFRSCLYGTAVLLQQGFDVAAVNDALDNYDVTLISLVPTMLYRLLDARPAGSWPRSLRLVLLGGAATPPELVEKSREQGVPISVTYGLTESSSQVATILPDNVPAKPGCVGKPLMFTSVRIADDNGKTLSPGEYGEVVVTGPSVMVGYIHDPAGTSRAIREGELYTGDIGYLDEDGDLWLVQRRSDIVVSGGENVYPAEVEAVLKQHPAVAAVCVVGVADEEWGQRVAAMVVSRDGATVSGGELVEFGRESLASYKLPIRIQFAKVLPQTASGKIERRTVQKMMNKAVPAAD
jgi:O-succinylbenzoic acid--CoA ligase